MRVGGLRQIQGLLQAQLRRCFFKQVVSAHHFRDAKRSIVDHHGERIGIDPIATTHDHIAARIRQILRLQALPHIIDVKLQRRRAQA